MVGYGFEVLWIDLGDPRRAGGMLLRCWGSLKGPWVSLGCPWRSLGALWCTFGVPGGPLDLSWEVLGGGLGGLLARLGSFLGLVRCLLRGSWGILECYDESSGVPKTRMIIFHWFYEN